MQNNTPGLYVVDYASLVEAGRMAPDTRAAQVLHGLSIIATDGRLKCVTPGWEKAKKATAVKDAFEGCTGSFVVPISKLTAPFKAIAPHLTGVLPFDAIDEDPDPWTLALAYEWGATVICELTIVRPLADGCAALHISRCSLADVITLEAL